MTILTINSRSRSVTLECPTVDSSVKDRHTTLTLFIASNEAIRSVCELDASSSGPRSLRVNSLLRLNNYSLTRACDFVSV